MSCSPSLRANHKQCSVAHYLIFKLMPVFALLAALSACTTVQQMALPQGASTNLAGKKFVTTVYPMPDMVNFTAGAALFGAIGGGVAIAQGRAMFSEYHIEDPARNIGEQLSKNLVASDGMTHVSNNNIVAADDDIPALISAYPGADYLLDVKTTGMMIHYYPTDWTHYRFTFMARVRLIEVATQKIVAQERCNSTEGDDAKPPTHDELLDNNASLLKAYMRKAGDGCVSTVSKDILRLPISESNRSAVAASTEKPVDSFIGINHAGTDSMSVDNASRWTGAMTCTTRKDMPDRKPYQVRFEMEINGTLATMHRKNEKVTETLSGAVRPNGALQLKGTGSRNANPASSWKFAIDGALAPDAKSFSGKGWMILKGQRIRDCELFMVPTA